MAGKISDLWARAAFYATLGSIIPASSVAGYFIGAFFDHHLKTGSALAIIGLVAGTGTGIFEVVQLIQRTEKNESNGGNNPPH